MFHLNYIFIIISVTNINTIQFVKFFFLLIKYLSRSQRTAHTGLDARSLKNNTIIKLCKKGFIIAS